MNVFIVENSAAMDKGLQSVLSDIPYVTVVGHSMDEQDAIEHIDALLPDAVILDVNLQSGSGIGVLENVKMHHPEIKVMVLTCYSDEFYADRSKYAGADYFFDKFFQLGKVRAVFWQWVHTDRLDNKFCSGIKFNALQIAGE